MNGFLKLGALALMGASLSGCIIVDADVQDASFGGPAGGLLYGADVSVRGPGEISIVVHSNGCTQKDDFSADVDETGDNSFRVRFERVHDDNCKALVPEGKRMTWSFAELDIPANAKVIVTNRVGR